MKKHLLFKILFRCVKLSAVLATMVFALLAVAYFWGDRDIDFLIIAGGSLFFFLYLTALLLVSNLPSMRRGMAYIKAQEKLAGMAFPPPQI
ncbi:MAG: hypothetical protein FWF59_09230 [Turicibacter sp.]|nr:hypothetical protein [Turicibacter sp.]